MLHRAPERGLFLWILQLRGGSRVKLVCVRIMTEWLALRTYLSVAEFIRNQRLKRAAYLLKEGNLVSQVAYSVGYSNLSNFSKIFKEKYGVAPSEYNG